MRNTPEAIVDAIRSSATKRDAAVKLGVTATHIGSVVHASGEPQLAAAWRRLPAEGAFEGISSRVPRATASQHLADRLVTRAEEIAPIDATATQRESILLLLLAALQLHRRHDLPRGWVLSVIKAFERAGHPHPPTPASLRWYRTRLQQDPNTFSDVPEVTRALSSMPRSLRKKLWGEYEMKETPKPVAGLNDIQALVREACEDSPLDRKRPERDNVVLLMLALYNITGSLDWPGDWLSAVSSAFVEAKAALPSRSTLSWYRNQLRDDPAKFENIKGVDPQLIEDLLTP